MACLPPGVATGECACSSRSAGTCAATHWSDSLSRFRAASRAFSFCAFSRCASILPRCRRAAFHRFARLLSLTGGSTSPSVMVANHSAWYACHASRSPPNESSVRGSPAVAEAASCSAVKRVGMAGRTGGTSNSEG